tara:strand:- start:1 stop:651 length:651 start_codon:yes stop_codon:yes gene_type:complete
MDEARERILAMSEAASEGGKPLSWFEELYSLAQRNDVWIPWSDGHPNPLVAEWVVARKTRGTALVVGCGLGEDAAFLEQRGWSVTAFDLSPTAVEWAKEQNPNSNIVWQTADLLDLPNEWLGAFDLVLEVHILQAMPESVRTLAAPKLSPLVAPEGSLVSIGRYQTNQEIEEGPPWPLSRMFIESIGGDLELDDLHITSLVGDEPEVKRYRAVWNA